MSTDALVRLVVQDSASAAMRAYGDATGTATTKTSTFASTLDTLQKVVTTANQGLELMGKAWSVISTSVGAVSSVVSGAIGSIKGVGTSLFDMSYNAYEAIDSLDEMSQQMGISARELQVMQKACEAGGASVGTLSGALRVLQMKAQDVADGNEKTAATFEKLGVKALDANGNVKPTGILFQEVADKLGKMEAGAGKTSLAVDVLGRSGTKLMAVFSGGGGSLTAAASSLEHLGTIITPQKIEDANRFEAAWLKMNGTMGSFAKVIGEALMPAFSGLMEKVTSFLDSFKSTLHIKSFTDSVSALINNAIRTINWDQAGREAARVANIVLDVFLMALDGVTAQIGKISFDDLIRKAERAVTLIRDELGKLQSTLDLIHLALRGMEMTSNTIIYAMEKMTQFGRYLTSEESKLNTGLMDEWQNRQKNLTSATATTRATEATNQSTIKLLDSHGKVAQTLNVENISLQQQLSTEAAMNQSSITLYDTHGKVAQTLSVEDSLIQQAREGIRQVAAGTERTAAAASLMTDATATGVSAASALSGAWQNVSGWVSSTLSNVNAVNQAAAQAATVAAKTPPAPAAAASPAAGGGGTGYIGGVAEYAYAGGGSASYGGAAASGSIGTPIDQGSAIYTWLTGEGNNFSHLAGGGTSLTSSFGGSRTQTGQLYQPNYNGAGHWETVNGLLKYIAGTSSDGSSASGGRVPIAGSGKASGGFTVQGGAKLVTVSGSGAGISQSMRVGPGGQLYNPKATATASAVQSGFDPYAGLSYTTETPMGYTALGRDGQMWVYAGREGERWTGGSSADVGYVPASQLNAADMAQLQSMNRSGSTSGSGAAPTIARSSSSGGGASSGATTLQVPIRLCIGDREFGDLLLERTTSGQWKVGNGRNIT